MKSASSQLQAQLHLKIRPTDPFQVPLQFRMPKQHTLHFVFSATKIHKSSACWLLPWSRLGQKLHGDHDNLATYFKGSHLQFLQFWGGSTHSNPSTSPPGMRISLPRHYLLGEERWWISRRRRAKSLFLNGLLLGSICTGIQVKLINHCQAVRIKQ